MSGSGSLISRAGPSLNIRNMTAFSKPNVEILLAGSQQNPDAYINSFSTLDQIKGVVKITARHDTRFDDLEITMNGECNIRTLVDCTYRQLASDHSHLLPCLRVLLKFHITRHHSEHRPRTLANDLSNQVLPRHMSISSQALPLWAVDKRQFTGF
jgi:hypothetical protein